MRTLSRSILIASLVVSALTIVATLSAQTRGYAVLHEFNDTPDGAWPSAGLTMDRAGNFYGTAPAGGANGDGLVFKLSHKGAGWVISHLYSFTGGSDSGGPGTPVTIGPDGNLYGTTFGDFTGTVYKLAPPLSPCISVSCPWVLTTLYSFSGGADGGGPNTVIFDRAGNLYGTTASGGSAGFGVVYELTRSGSGWTETVLHSFTGPPDGEGPGSGVVFDQAGNLYGTTTEGGIAHLSCGIVYRLTPSGSGWTENILYTFQGQDDGCFPVGGLTFDPAANLYGTTTAAGSNRVGTVFELVPSGGNWSYNVIYTFGQSPAAHFPTATLTLDAAGNLYGTNKLGGRPIGSGECAMGQGCGDVFKLTFSSGVWTYSSLHLFTEYDGGQPEGGVILDAAGNLYGTTWEGGTESQQCQGGDYFGCGVIFEITQ